MLQPCCLTLMLCTAETVPSLSTVKLPSSIKESWEPVQQPHRHAAAVSAATLQVAVHVGEQGERVCQLASQKLQSVLNRP